MATRGGQPPCPHLAQPGESWGWDANGLSWYPYPCSEMCWDSREGTPGPRDQVGPPSFPLLPWLHCPSRLLSLSYLPLFLHSSLSLSLSAQPKGTSDCQLRPPQAAQHRWRKSQACTLTRPPNLSASASQPSPRYKESSSVPGSGAGARLRGRASQGGNSYLSSSSSSSSWTSGNGC